MFHEAILEETWVSFICDIFRRRANKIIYHQDDYQQQYHLNLDQHVSGLWAYGLMASEISSTKIKLLFIDHKLLLNEQFCIHIYITACSVLFINVLV